MSSESVITALKWGVAELEPFPHAMPKKPDSNEERGAEEKVIKMFSLCFIELQQMSNKLEKMVVFFFPNSLAFYLCSVPKWGAMAGAVCKHNSYCNIYTR